MVLSGAVRNTSDKFYCASSQLPSCYPKFWRRVLLPVIARYRDLKVPMFFRGDAAFASPKLMKLLEADGVVVHGVGRVESVSFLRALERNLYP